MNVHSGIPGLDESAMAFLDLSTSDVALISGGLLWCVLLRLSLGGIDRRDAMTGFTYVLYMMGAGATLLLALPGQHDIFADDRRQMLLVCFMGGVAAYRWLRRPKVKEEKK